MRREGFHDKVWVVLHLVSQCAMSLVILEKGAGSVRHGRLPGQLDLSGEINTLPASGSSASGSFSFKRWTELTIALTSFFGRSVDI